MEGWVNSWGVMVKLDLVDDSRVGSMGQWRIGSVEGRVNSWGLMAKPDLVDDGRIGSMEGWVSGGGQWRVGSVEGWVSGGLGQSIAGC